MIDIQKIAEQAGINIVNKDEYDLINQEELTRFAALYREAVVQELVAGSGEPDGLWAYDETVMAWREYNREGFDSCTGTKLEAYTKEQLAGAVLRERERCAKVCDEYAKNSSNPMNFAENCAASIRSGE